MRPTPLENVTSAIPSGLLSPELQVQDNPFYKLSGSHSPAFASVHLQGDRRARQEVAKHLLISAWTDHPLPGEEESRDGGRGEPRTQLLCSVLTSRKIDMPLDSCRAELSSSEELLEDGDVSRESSILASPDGGGGRSGAGRPHGLGQGRGRTAAGLRLPGVRSRPRASPASLSASRLRPPRSHALSFAPPPSLGCWRRIRLIAALSNRCAPRGEPSLTPSQPLAAAGDDPGAPAPPTCRQGGGDRAPGGKGACPESRGAALQAPRTYPVAETLRVQGDSKRFCQLCFSTRLTCPPHPPQRWVGLMDLTD